MRTELAAILAHPPFEYNEMEHEMSKEDFKIFLASFGEESLENEGYNELIRFELSWHQGKMMFKILHKRIEQPTPGVEDGDREGAGIPEKTDP